MAQINLLKQNAAPASDFSKTIPKMVVRFFLLILICLVLYYGWLFLKSKSLDNQTLQLQAKMAAEVRTALSNPDRNEVLTRQLQIKTLGGLVASHVYWSQLFQPLGDATLKNATYKNLTVGLDGSMSLDVTVPSIEDMDKFLQTFNIPKYYGNFNSILVGGFTKVQDKTLNTNSIEFVVQMKFNPDLIQYHNPSKNAS